MAFSSLAFFLVVLISIVACDRHYEVCNVQQMGGVGDGSTDNTALFRKLFSECDEVIVPFGETYLTFPLNITRHNFVLVLEGTLLFYDMSNLTDWPLMPHLPSYPCDRDICSCCRYQPPILIYRAKNVTIQGEGELNGQGALWWQAFRSKTLTYGRPRLLQTMHSSKVKILNIKLVDSPFWTCHLYSSEEIYIEGVTVLADFTSPNTDGFDPDSSHYVHIKNCQVHNGDDCIAIKSGMDEAGLAYNRSSAHIFISDLKCFGDGISIGSEISGGIEDVLISNSQANKRLYLKTAPSRGGYIRDVTFTNILIEGNYQTDVGGLIIIGTNYGTAPPAPIPSIIDNIRYDGITGRGEWAGKLLCTEEIPCTNLVLVDVNLDTKEGFECSNVTTAAVHNVHPEWCN